MESQKANDPGVKTPQVEKLQEQFMNLQQEWESYKQSNPKTKRRSSCSSSSCTLAKTVDQLLDNSPRHLMSSLQHIMPSSKGDNWNVRTNDLAVEEIRRDRRTAIESGKMKGRRLFEDYDQHEETEIGYGGEEDSWDDWDQESEKRSLPLYSSGDEGVDSGESKEIKVCFQDSISSLNSSLCGEKMKEEENSKLVTVEKKEVLKIKGGDWGRCIVMIMPVLAIAALIFAICSMRGLYGYGNEHYEQILVPT